MSSAELQGELAALIFFSNVSLADFCKLTPCLTNFGRLLKWTARKIHCGKTAVRCETRFKRRDLEVRRKGPCTLPSPVQSEPSSRPSTRPCRVLTFHAEPPACTLGRQEQGLWLFATERRDRRHLAVMVVWKDHASLLIWLHFVCRRPLERLHDLAPCPEQVYHNRDVMESLRTVRWLRECHRVFDIERSP